MREKFYEYLMNGLNDYDRKYLPTMDYVLMLFSKGKIKAYFAKKSYVYFVEYPSSEYEYNSPMEVLKEEMDLGGIATSGIIYEKQHDNTFKEIAFIDLNEK